MRITQIVQEEGEVLLALVVPLTTVDYKRQAAGLVVLPLPLPSTQNNRLVQAAEAEALVGGGVDEGCREVPRRKDSCSFQTQAA